MDVGVDSARGDDLMFAGDDFGSGADDEGRVDAVMDVGVARFSDGADTAVFDADVGLEDAEDWVEDDGVG